MFSKNMVLFFGSFVGKCTYLFFFALLFGSLLACSGQQTSKNDPPLNSIQYRSIGEQIRVKRLDKGMSQAQLAEAAGISQNALSLIEDGLATPIMSKIVEIERLLEMDFKLDSLKR